MSIKNLFNGGLRDRLSIELKDGREVLFVVGNLQQVIGELSRHIHG